MRYALELEDFGDPLYKAVHGNKAWVAKINLNGGKIKRTFIKPMIDYANADRHLSSGIYRYYFLDDGDYEVSYPLGHRLDGPAIVLPDGTNLYRIHNTPLTSSQFEAFQVLWENTKQKKTKRLAEDFLSIVISRT